MKNKKDNLKRYLLISFIIAYLIQFCAIVAFANQDNLLYQGSLMIMMYTPFIAVFFCDRTFSGMGWKPEFKGKNVGFFFISWLVPGVLAVIGAAIFFLIFRNAFDNTGMYFTATAGADTVATMEAQGISMPQYNLITIVSAFTYAPILNMFLALGEEVGWRGYMYPILKKQYGVNKGRLLGGFIWGVWHWPVMTIGYEYGINYPGYPILGPFIFCIFTIAAGILLDWIYEQSHIIWLPALAHGAINAATFGLMYLNPDYSNIAILGPVQNGLISMIPLIIIAAVITYKENQKGIVAIDTQE